MCGIVSIFNIQQQTSELRQKALRMSQKIRRKVVDEKRENSSVYGSPEEMQEKAKEGYFVRDPERNLVYCPAGEILRQKSMHRKSEK